MACDCLHDVNEHLATHNTRICESFVPWVEGPIVTLMFEKISDDEPNVAIATPLFCPFCGERYATEPTIGETRAGEISSHVH